MNPNKIIVYSAMMYSLLFILANVLYSTTKFTDSDAAGNGLSAGLTYFFWLCILLIIAIILTTVNFTSFGKTTFLWIKFFYFIPILLPITALTVTFLNDKIKVAKSEAQSIEETYLITIEIRTLNELDTISVAFISEPLQPWRNKKVKQKQKAKDAMSYYAFSKVIMSSRVRKFYIESGGFKTPVYHLEMPYKLQIIPYTNWRPLVGINKYTQEIIELDFRYTIKKPLY